MHTSPQTSLSPSSSTKLSPSTGEIAMKVLNIDGDATEESTKDYHQPTNVSKRSSSILELPNELLVQIISHLYNKNLVNLATTCHILHDLADGPLQEHQRLLQEWTFVSNFNQRNCWLASRVVRQLHDRRLTTYTRRLEITLLEPRLQLQDPQAAREEYVAEPTHADIPNLWNPRCDLELDIAGLWHNSVMTGNIDFVLTAWCTILQNVTHLGLYLGDRDCGHFLTVLRPQSKGYLPSVENLTDVRINGCSSQAYELLELCAQLPRICNLAAGSVLVHSPQVRSIVPKSYISTIKSFLVEGCSFGQAQLLAFVNSIKSLEQFSYQEERRDEPDYDELEKVVVIDSLRNTARKTLRTLYLIDMTSSWRSVPPPRLGSLVEFDVLHDITLDFDYMLDWTGFPIVYSPTGLHERLSKSLRTLMLTRMRQPLPRTPVAIVIDLLLRQKENYCRSLEQFYELLIMYVEPKAVEELQTESIIEWSGRVGLEIHLETEEGLYHS